LFGTSTTGLPIVSPQKDQPARETGCPMRMDGGGEDGWLIPGDGGHSNLSEIAAGLLKFDAYCHRNKGDWGRQ
jgi:hypothetical protein